MAWTDWGSLRPLPPPVLGVHRKQPLYAIVSTRAALTPQRTLKDSRRAFNNSEGPPIRPPPRAPLGRRPGGHRFAAAAIGLGRSGLGLSDSLHLGRGRLLYRGSRTLLSASFPIVPCGRGGFAKALPSWGEDLGDVRLFRRVSCKMWARATDARCCFGPAEGRRCSSPPFLGRGRAQPPYPPSPSLDLLSLRSFGRPWAAGWCLLSKHPRS